MPRKETTWPKEIIVCLACGKVGATGYELRLGDDCVEDGDHGPTQAVPVIPASVAEGLVEALRYIDGEDIPSYEAHMPPQEVARKALSQYRDAMGDGR